MLSRLSSALTRAAPFARMAGASARRPISTAGCSGFLLAAATGGSVAISQCGSGPDYGAIRDEIEAIMEDENSYNPSVDNAPGVLSGGGDIGPVLVRLAWHCAGTWDKDAQNGGSDGATMRFSPEADHGGNAGLGHARNLLEPVKAKHPEISYADLYIYAGKVAIEAMGGPDLPFHAGRTDASAGRGGAPDTFPKGVHSPDGRLPDGDKGAGHIRDIFYRMGFNDQEIVALSGAHCLGRCHTDRSGFWGPWSRSPSTFSNEYFRLLLEEKWSPKTTHNGKPWGASNPQLENSDGTLMMLYTDIALIQDAAFRPWVEKYAADEELFFKDYAKAWTKLTELGCDGKLGGGSSGPVVLGAALGTAVAHWMTK